MYNIKRMHRKTSKRRQRAQLTFVYMVMTFAVVASVATLMMIVLGYRFNRYDGKVEQGGLVQFDSRPSGAEVTLDTVHLANKTASKITATAGAHTVTMTKPGYMTWRKDVTVKPGSVLWLNYARLLPTDLQPSTVLSGATVSSSVPSPDNKWLLVSFVAHEPVLTLVALDNVTLSPVKIALSATSYTQATDPTTQRFDVLSWDQDNRYALVKHSYDSTVEYLWIDTHAEDGAVRNVTNLLGVAIQQVAFVLGDSQSVYIVTDTHELRRGDLNARTLSGPLMTNVASFDQFDRSTVTFVTLPDATQVRSAGYLTEDAKSPRIVSSKTDDGTAPYAFTLGRYYNNNYAVLSYGAQAEILKGDFPASDSTAKLDWKRITTLDVPGGAQRVGFSVGENRFVFVQTSTAMKTYDLELLGTATITGMTSTELEPIWIDGYHLATVAGGVAAITDFDGTNRQIYVAKNAIGLRPVFSNNGKYLYQFVRTADGVALHRFKLSID